MKTILVTGSTDGIGLATAEALTRLGNRVILHGRNEARAKQAQEIIGKRVPEAVLESVAADLASLEEVRRLAGEIRGRFDRLDVLINNAGVATNARTLSHDGFELTFAVNHLAPFLLTNLLLDLLTASAPARVVTVSSMTHAHATMDLNDLQGEKGFEGYDAYSRSKLANILFTNELARRCAGTGLTANALHPGVIDTKLLRVSFSGGGPPEAGAETSVYLATSAEVEEVTGTYFVSSRPARISAQAADPALALELWNKSARLTGLPVD